MSNAGSNNISIISTQTNTVVGNIPTTGSQPYGVAFSPSGTFAYVANEGSANVAIINTATNTVVGNIPIPNSSLISITFNPSGTLAYVIDQIGDTSRCSWYFDKYCSSKHYD